MEQLIKFHQELNEVIIAWAEMIYALLVSDTPATVAIAVSLMELQPEARCIDHVVDRP